MYVIIQHEHKTVSMRVGFSLLSNLCWGIMKVCEAVENFITPFAEQCGVEILEVEYAKKSDGMNLTIFIDKEGGITLDDCERLHRLIDEPLDELDPTDGKPYTLNVSSPGLDRPLKNQKDFKRNLNKEITVKLFAALNGKKIYQGFLRDYDEETFVLETEKGLVKFEKKKTALVEPLIRF